MPHAFLFCKTVSDTVILYFVNVFIVSRNDLDKKGFCNTSRRFSQSARTMVGYEDVVGQDAKALHIHKIEAVQPSDEPEQIILFRIFKGKPIQRCLGNDVVYCRDVQADRPG